MSVEGVDIGVLHADILSVIFSFTPQRARLRAIGLVCKRWRLAALRSMTAFTWPLLRGSRTRDETPALAPALSLFSSLTALDIRSDCVVTSLPTTLTHLHLGPKVGAQLLRQDPPIVLATYLPFLSSLSVDGPHVFESPVPLADFVILHASQLSSLCITRKEGIWESLLARRIVFPRLKSIDMSFWLSRIRDLPAIVSLAPNATELSLKTDANIFELPPSVLPLVVSFVGTACKTDTAKHTMLRPTIEAMTKLQHVKLTSLSRLPSWLDPLLSELFAHDDVHLLTATNVQCLTIGHECLPANLDSLPQSLHWPHLTELVLRMPDTDRMWPYVHFFLRRTPSLKELFVNFDKEDFDISHVAALAHEAIQYGVRRFTFGGYRPWKRDSPLQFAIQYGWLEIGKSAGNLFGNC